MKKRNVIGFLFLVALILVGWPGLATFAEENVVVSPDENELKYDVVKEEEREARVCDAIDELLVDPIEIFVPWYGYSLELFEGNVKTNDGEYLYCYRVIVSDRDEGYVVATEKGDIFTACPGYCAEIDDFTRNYAYSMTAKEIDELFHSKDINQEELIEEKDTETLNESEALIGSDMDLSVSSTGSVLPGVSPQMQGSYNCLTAAASNVMWYYSNNYYSALCSGLTFDQVKSMMASFYVSAGGEGVNSNSPSAIYWYVKTRSPIRNVTTSVNTSPSSALLINEIDSGHPCMLGFAAGSVSDWSDPHMTMGCGYTYISSTLYSCVVTGYQSYIRTFPWSSGNDCLISVYVY